MELRVRSQKGSRENRNRITRATDNSTNRVIAKEPVVNSNTIKIIMRESPTLYTVSSMNVRYYSKLK